PDTFTVDTRLPSTPTIDPLPTAPGGQAGFTSSLQPGFTGRGIPGDTLTLSKTSPGSGTICTAIVQASGNWTCTASAPLTGSPATQYTVQAVQVSQSGVSSPPSLPLTFTVDTHT